VRSHVTSTSAGWGQVFWDGTESDTVYLNLFLGESSNRGTIHNGVRAGGALSGANYWYAKPQPPTSNAPAPPAPPPAPLLHYPSLRSVLDCLSLSLSLSLTHTHTQPRARVDQREVPPPNLIEAVGIFCLVVQVQLQPLRRGRCDCRRRQLPARAARSVVTVGPVPRCLRAAAAAPTPTGALPQSRHGHQRGCPARRCHRCVLRIGMPRRLRADVGRVPKQHPRPPAYAHARAH